MRHYAAIVSDNADPDKRGRLKLEIPGLLDGVHPEWIDPRAPSGPASVWIPRKDDRVIVERSEGGDLRWSGGLVIGAALPDVFRKDYGERHGIASADGAAAVVLVNGGGILVLAGSSGTITLATGEDARTEPVVLGDTFGGSWDDLLTALTTLAAALVPVVSPATVSGIGPAGTALQTSLGLLKRAAAWKSSKVSTE